MLPIRLSGSSTSGSVAQAHSAPEVCTPAKHFYSLMVEVCLEEADAETLRLFSETGVSNLSATLNLPAGCELRRCLYMAPEYAEMLIRM